MQCKSLSLLVRRCMCGYDFKMSIIGFMNNKASRVEMYYNAFILRLFCCLFAWESTRHWLTTRLCSSKDKRFIYFSFHVIFFFKPILQPATRTFGTFFFCRCYSDAIVACLFSPCFKRIHNHNSLHAKSRFANGKRAQEAERQNKWESSSERTTRPKFSRVAVYSHEQNRE